MNEANALRHHRHDSSIEFASGTNVVLAIWLLISPWIIGHDSAAILWDDVIVGAVVLILGLIRARAQSRGGVPSWINLVAGIWLIISPFALRGASQGQEWNCIVVGVCMALLALASGVAGASRTQ